MINNTFQMKQLQHFNPVGGGKVMNPINSAGMLCI